MTAENRELLPGLEGYLPWTLQWFTGYRVLSSSEFSRQARNPGICVCAYEIFLPPNSQFLKIVIRF